MPLHAVRNHSNFNCLLLWLQKFSEFLSIVLQKSPTTSASFGGAGSGTVCTRSDPETLTGSRAIRGRSPGLTLPLAYWRLSMLLFNDVNVTKEAERSQQDA